MKLRYLRLSDLHLVGSEEKEPVDSLNQSAVTSSMLKYIEKFVEDQKRKLKLC